MQLSHGIGIHVGERPRERLQDRYLSACPGIDMAEFKRDAAAADKHDVSEQAAFIQHIVGSDHQLGAGKREVARLRASSDDNVLGLQHLPIHYNSIRTGEPTAIAGDFDAALVHQVGEGALNAATSPSHG
jgi:hypothetical protein